VRAACLGQPPDGVVQFLPVDADAGLGTATVAGLVGIDEVA
jgi:hypothetical protein